MSDVGRLGRRNRSAPFRGTTMTESAFAGACLSHKGSGRLSYRWKTSRVWSAIRRLHHATMHRAEILDRCDAELRDKPHLATVFDPAWRESFRREILAMAPETLPGYPMAYFLPIMHGMHPGFYPADTQARVERGLAIVWSQMNGADRAELTKRLREGDGIIACDELLAASAFAAEFGDQVIKWPSAPMGQRRPEFFVEADFGKFAVECKAIQDNESVRGLNAAMMATGQPWIASLDHNHDPNRLRSALVRKIQRAQGGGPAVIMLMAQTPWIMPDRMDEEVRRVLCTPSAVKLSPADLPIAVACLTLTTVQGVWFSDTACRAAGVDAAARERIRGAITRGFVARGDGNLLTESSWSDCE